jgi:putative membrane protein
MLLPAYAQSDQSSSTNLTASDQVFIKKAAEGNLAEMQMGQLGQQKATDPDVRRLADELVSEHDRNQKQIQSLAQQSGVTLPTSLSAEDRAEKERLEKLSGAEFDREFASHMASEHQRDIAEFQKQASTTKDPSVKSYAESTLPTMQKHLQMAETATGQSSEGHHEHSLQDSHAHPDKETQREQEDHQPNNPK